MSHMSENAGLNWLNRQEMALLKSGELPSGYVKIAIENDHL